MPSQSFDEILENAFLDGDPTTLLNIFVENSNNELLNYAINKIVDVIASYLSSLPENEAIVSNILSILMELNGVLELNFEQNVILVKYVLFLVTEENSPLGVLKRAAHILSTYFSNPSIIEWLKNEESLEGSLQILGRKIAIIGDYECQTFMFEALCRFITDEDKIQWARTWFPDAKTRSLFLNLNPPQFEMDCRKILNHINRSEPNPRTHAFVATAVYFGPYQLKKPYGLEFWIDFNYDSQSISFFCSEFGPDLLCHNSTSWETILISSDIVDYYTVQNKRIMKSKEICIYLKCVCNDLLPVGSPIYPEFQTNCIRIIFWSFQDINQPLEMTFGKSIDVDNGLNTESQGNSSTSQNCRKVSNSADVLSIQKGTGDREDFRKVSVCNVLEIPDKEERCERIGRRVSDSTDIIHLSNTNKKQIDHHSIQKNYDTGQKNAALNKRKASCSSMNLKESDSESDLQRSDIKKHISVKHAYSSNDNNSADVEKLNIEGDIKYYRSHDVEKFSSASTSVRKSSDASCNIDLNNDDSQSDVDEQVEKNASESLLKDEEKSLFQANGVMPKNILSDENKDFNLFIRKGQKIVENDAYFSEASQISSKIQKEPLYKDSKTKKNVDRNTSLQTEEVNVSFDRNCDSQNSLRVDNGIRKVSQSFSDLGDTCISPTPVNKRKLPRKTNKLISKPCKDSILSENQTFVKSPISIKADENKALNTIINNSQPINFKNSNSESYYVKDLLQNSRQKKIRLYNINKDPVYDVPPHQKKKLNDNVIKDSTAIESFKKDNEKLLSNSAEKNNEDICKSKERVDVLHKKPSNLLIAEKYLHSTLNNVENKLSNEDQELENIVHENGENKNQEKSSKEDENEYLTKKKSACYEPKPKKLKKYHDSDIDYSPGRRLERQINEVGKETISQSFSTKKPRIAALNAMKKNKTILEQKTSEKGSEICNLNHSSKSNDNFYKIEENISTPTKTAKKPRLRKSEDNILTPTKTEKSPRLRKSEENILTSTRTAKKPRLRNSEENILTSTRIVKKSRLRNSEENMLTPTKTEKKPSEENTLTLTKTAKKPRLKKSEENILTPTKTAKKPRLKKSEENILTPTKTAKKPRLRKSVFTTDTETGSSEVSWFGQKRSHLFETPKKIYSNWKNKQETKDSHSRQRTYKSRNAVTRSKKKQNLVSLSPELTSKNTLSDLENYELLIERKSNYKSASYFNRDNLRITENMLDTLEVYDFEEETNIEDNNSNQVYSNNETRIHKTSNHNTEEEWDIQDVEDNDYFTSEAMKQTEITNDNLSPNLTVAVNMSKGQLKQAISNKVKSGSPKLSNPKKNISNGDIHIERASEQLSLSSSTKKRKSNDFPSFNKRFKKVKMNDNAAHRISLDTITYSEISCNAYTDNKSILPGSSSSNKMKSHFSKVSNNYFPNVPISMETRLKDSPTTTKSNRYSLLYTKKNVECDNFIPEKDMLSKESLTSLNNEVSGKRLHMQRFLESLSGDSNSPKDIQYGKEKAELTSVEDSMHLKKGKKYFESIIDSKKSPCDLNSKRTSETDSEKLPLLENFSNHWPPKEKIDSHKRICKTKEKKRSKSFAILNLLAGEVDNLTRSLLGTLQKCSRDFSAKVASLRENISVTASALTSKDSELPPKDLKNFAITCKQNRINAEKSLKKMLSIGQEYFEAEKRYDDKMKKLYRKAMKKYATKIEMAENIATKALEETIISKTDTFLKNIVKKIDDL